MHFDIIRRTVSTKREQREHHREETRSTRTRNRAARTVQGPRHGLHVVEWKVRLEIVYRAFHSLE